MKFQSVVLMLVAVAFLTSCASNKNKEEAEADATSETRQMPNPVSVGAVEATFEMIELNDGALSVKVVEVIGYGASAPRLATGETITFQMQETISEALTNLKPGDSFNASIAKSPQGINLPESGWRIVELIDK